MPPRCPGRDDARIDFEGLKSVPVIVDHEEVLNEYAEGSFHKRKDARAIRIHRIGAGVSHRDYIAVLAHRGRCRDRGAALSVEALRTNFGERSGKSGRGRNEFTGGIHSLQAFRQVDCTGERTERSSRP